MTEILGKMQIFNVQGEFDYEVLKDSITRFLIYDKITQSDIDSDTNQEGIIVDPPTFMNQLNSRRNS
jgi:hypothetical protein